MLFSRLSTLMVLLSFFATSCAAVDYSHRSMPQKPQPKFITAKFSSPETAVGSVYRDVTTNDPELSGAILVTNGTHALYLRIAMARMAQHTIELQTYIYTNDISSRLLMHEMKLAADRGVHVRILVDDLGLDSDHSDIMLMNEHPNIEVRVFNPFRLRSRGLRVLQLAFDFERMNRRMHNKLFSVDNAATIIGGRNLAGNYFDDKITNFSDTDVLFLGKLAYESSRSFYRYWDFHKSIPVSSFPGHENATGRLTALDAEIMKNFTAEQITAHNDQTDALVSNFLNKQYQVHWGKGELLVDSPYKVDGYEPQSPFYEKIKQHQAGISESVYIVSAYLVPKKEGVEIIYGLQQRGVDVRILTNSLSSTDLKTAYMAWKPYRDELLERGIKIYEFRNEGFIGRLRHSSGASSLHSKVMVLDDKSTWIGSFNFDPRSLFYNTEIAAIFHSEDFARVVKSSIENDMSMYRSWELYRTDGRTFWKTRRNGEEYIHWYSPDVSLPARIMSLFMQAVPEDLL